MAAWTCAKPAGPGGVSAQLVWDRVSDLLFGPWQSLAGTAYPKGITKEE